MFKVCPNFEVGLKSQFQKVQSSYLDFHITSLLSLHFVIDEHGLVLTLFKEVFKGSFEMCVANDISPANLYDDGHYL